MMRIGSLFSGIGGLELGLEWSGIGHTVWQVEIDPRARAVLATHWPDAARYEDVRTVGAATLAPVDLICGGFPCQDVSSAGKRAGLDGARSGLWFEFHRIVSEIRPRWVVVENVAGGAARWVDAIVSGLGELGYACLPVPLAAADVGAPHQRARVFIVAAYAHHQSDDVAQQPRSSDPGVASDAGCEFRPGQPRRGGSGRSVSPVAGEVGAGRDTADAHGELGDARQGDARTERAGRPVSSGAAVADAVHTRREGPGPGAYASGQRPAPGAWWASEPGVGPVVHGLSGGLAGRARRAKIRALGNSVVPQCAEVVGWVIRHLEAGAA